MACFFKKFNNASCKLNVRLSTSDVSGPDSGKDPGVDVALSPVFGIITIGDGTDRFETENEAFWFST